MPTRQTASRHGSRAADGPYSVYPRPGAAAPPQPADGEIAALAYQLWLERGCRHGFDVDDWLLAAEILRRRNGG
jgi:hypothetical protein